MKFLGRWYVRFGFAVAMAAAGLLLRFAITRFVGQGFPTYITFYPVVMLVALWAGFWPGVVATVLSALLVDYWILPPIGNIFLYQTFVELVGQLFFVGMGLFMCAVAYRYRMTQGRLREQMKVLAVERRRFNDVLDMLPAYVVLITPDHHVPFANRYFTQRFGVSNGKKCFEYLFGHSAPCENCETFKVLKTNTPHHWEWTGPDKRNYDVYDFPFADTDGSPLVMEMGIDITDRKKAEAALLEANEMKLLGQITSGVAHEVRNPLNGIMAIMGALSKELSNDDRFQPYMQHMRSQVTRLTMLMEDLLSLGRIARDENMHEVSITTLVENAVATWLQTVQPPRPIVRFVKPEKPEQFVIRAESTYMTQMIINLLENARNHSTADVEIICSVDGNVNDTVIFSVKDRGAGISEENLPKIFDPFFTTRKGGTGLGLSIVRHVVEDHEGSIIALNNTDGPGATFKVVLPLYIKK